MDGCNALCSVRYWVSIRMSLRLLLLQVLTMNLRSAALAGQPLPPPESELDYPSIINRALPDDIRVLGWTDVPNPDFDARCATHCSCSHVLVQALSSLACTKSASPNPGVAGLSCTCKQTTDWWPHPLAPLQPVREYTVVLATLLARTLRPCLFESQPALLAASSACCATIPPTCVPYTLRPAAFVSFELSVHWAQSSYPPPIIPQVQLHQS